MRHLLLAVALATAACGETVITGSSAEFELAVGERALLTEHDVAVTFREVTADSRCPSDVTCVWAGDGAVRLELVAAAASADVTVHTLTDPRAAEFGPIRLQLVSLSPEPRSDRPIPGDGYRVVLRIDPR